MSGREVKKAGVVGLGTMGAGIAQLCVQAGVPTVAVEATPELAERGRGRIEARARAPGREGHDHVGAARRDARAARAGHRRRCARGLRPRDRGGVREPRGEARALRPARSGARAGRGARHQHLGAVGDRDRRTARAPRARGRDALLQPRAGAAARRGRPRPSATSRRGLRHRRTRSRSGSARTRSPASTRRASSSTGS